MPGTNLGQKLRLYGRVIDRARQAVIALRGSDGKGSARRAPSNRLIGAGTASLRLHIGRIFAYQIIVGAVRDRRVERRHRRLDGGIHTVCPKNGDYAYVRDHWSTVIVEVSSYWRRQGLTLRVDHGHDMDWPGGLHV